jgi:hypothetical protein
MRRFFYLVFHLTTFSTTYTLNTSRNGRADSENGKLVAVGNEVSASENHKKKSSHCVQFLERKSNPKPQECEKTVLTAASSSVIPNFKGRRSDFGDVVQNFRK